ncbi:MAG: hypothetical protein AAGF88_10485 [Pseudomonadota bacterium]
MSISWKKPLSAMALSLSLAFGAVTVPAAPAHAVDAENVAGILAGLAALYVIGRAIDERNDRNDRSEPVTRHSGTIAPPARARIAPARCFRDFGAVRGYLMRCMQNHVPRPNLLPAECLVRINTDRGVRNLYTGRCLHRNGWTREAGFRP